MTGDWGGLRKQLRDAGVSFTAGYVGEWASDLAGGMRLGGDLASQFAIGLSLDTARLIGWPGGTFNVTLNSRIGRSTSADFVGNRLAVQEAYGAGENSRLAELSYEQAVLGSFVRVKVGYYPLGNDFATTPILCAFQNTGFCQHPQSLPNDSGWADYPAARWGGRIRADMPSGSYGEVGVFQVNPTYNLHGNGFKLGLNGSTGVIVPLEFGLTVHLEPVGLPGHLKAGAYYDSSTVADAAISHLHHAGRYGGWLLADQMILQFQQGTERGVVLVLTGTVSDRATAPIPTNLVAAAVAQGPFAARPYDTFGIAYTRAWSNGRALSVEKAKLTSRGLDSSFLARGEGLIEVAYGAQLTPWLIARPNVQYVFQPGAFSHRRVPDAWVLGLQTKLVF